MKIIITLKINNIEENVHVEKKLHDNARQRIYTKISAKTRDIDTNQNAMPSYGGKFSANTSALHGTNVFPFTSNNSLRRIINKEIDSSCRAMVLLGLATVLRGPVLWWGKPHSNPLWL